MHQLPVLQSDSKTAEPTGKLYWRSLEELAGDEAFVAALRREFPEHIDQLAEGPTRRRFLQFMGASLAMAGASGCVEQPQEQIVSYVRAPEQMKPGKPLYYATAMTHDGAGVGLLVESQMGRPIKIEGNPLHPAVPEIMKAATGNATRFGATDPVAQALVLSLYDPDRSQTVERGRQIDTWESFSAELGARLAGLKPHGGHGLRLLTQTVVSPTLADQTNRLLAEFPNARWHQYEPVNRDNAVLGNRLALGTDVEPIYNVEAADVILSLDADFLIDGAMRLPQARGFADRRRLDGKQRPAADMNRLYVVETSPSLTGAAADHRLPLAPRAIVALAARLAAALGMSLDASGANAAGDVPQAWFDAVVEDLQRVRGRSLVIAGRNQPPIVHAVAHWINNALGNVGQTVEYRAPHVARTEPHVESIRELAGAMQADEVQTLLILGGNPVYDAPADVGFGEALRHVPFSVHLNGYADETSARCNWHLPEAHPLESWSDTRAGDGTASIVQPLIAPLFRGKSAHELLALVLGSSTANGYEVVRDYWQRWHTDRQGSGDFETFWQTALHDGVVAGSESARQPVSLQGGIAAELVRALVVLEKPATREQPTLVFRPDASAWDGRLANNGWMQELPRPLTKITWDNAALVSPQLAERLGLAADDVASIALGDRSLELPVAIVPGHCSQTITVHLGYGRTRAGRVGNGVGVNVYPLRTSHAMDFATGATVRGTGRKHALAATQTHHNMEGRHLVRAGTMAEYEADPAHPAFMAVGHDPPADATVYPPFEYDGNKWGMVVNQSSCIGCNACTIACQAENNIPIVGREEVANGREMHWIRLDHYYEGEPENPDSFHQPVMCQHCELAPCEVVCPVAATTHSDEGLNEMTYNRCVGTRYCANNCPYKVRRFNFLDYNTELRSDARLQLLTNPDVTVRSRGVMEKCTYCVQRINSARIDAEKQDRPIRDGEVVTACQAVCPTEAIVFGNLNDAESRVKQASKSSLNYSLLGDLNTRPRTQYLAAVRNPHPGLG